jgi:hypothetical protein
MVAAARIGARLQNDGTLFTAGEFDETFQNTHSITESAIFADLLDEVTIPGSGSVPAGTPSGGSIALNGTSQYIGVAGSGDFQFGTGDFTIEGWYYVKDSTNLTRLWSFPDGDNVEVQGTSLYYWNGGTPATSGSNVIPLFQWFHVALVKKSGYVTVYVNGVGKITDNAPFNSTVSRPLAIGGEVISGTTDFLNGYFTNFRVVKGTAVYPSNFSAPIAPFTAITNTVLLLSIKDKADILTDSSGSIPAKAVNNIGGATYDALTPLSTIYNGTMKQLHTGTLQVANEFDEQTGIV